MSVKAITPSLNARVQYNNNKNNALENNKIAPNTQQAGNQPSFTGGAKALVGLMDWIEKGGFITSFIIVDGIGMVIPRIGTGLMRGYGTIDEKTGEKRGMNWEFARREALREVISGPITYLLPLAMITGIKLAGKANNVPVDLINAYAPHFTEYAKGLNGNIPDKMETRKAVYESVFKNILTNSSADAVDVNAKAADYAEKLVEINNTSSKKVRKSLVNELNEDFIKFRKQHNPVFIDDTVAVLDHNGKKITKGFEKILTTVSDYTDDVFKYTKKNLTERTAQAVEQLTQNFTLKRTGTRVLTNLSMWGGVAAALTVIPKIYNLGLKHDPGLVGTAAEGKGEADDKAIDNTNLAQKAQAGQQTSFTGLGSSVGKKVLSSDKLNKFLSNVEFDNAAIPANAMAALLFGFCLPPRYVNAKSNFERAEILVRDIASFTAILFGVKALSRMFSEIFTKTSGLALQTRSDDYSKRSVPGKIWQYFSANSDINNLSTSQLEAKYANISSSKEGLTGLANYIEKHGGNIKKVFSIDKNIKQNLEALLGGKSLKDATTEEIKNVLKMKDTKEIKKIVSILDDVKTNKILGRAKFLNSLFGAVSTFALVPLFMIWLSEQCKKMTHKRAEAMAKNAEVQQQPQITPATVTTAAAGTNQPSMQGFLNKL